MSRRIAVALVSVLILPTWTNEVRADGSTYSYTWTCSSSQCAAVMGGYSGTQGPFASQSDCEASRRSILSSTSCQQGGAGGGIGSTTLVGAAVRAAMGNMSSQQAMGATIGVVGLALLMKGLNESSQQQAAADEAAQRQAQQAALERQRQADEAQRQLLAELKMPSAGDNLHLKGVGESSDLRPKLSGDPNELGLKLGDTTTSPGEPANDSGRQQYSQGTPFFGDKTANCPPSRDASVVDLCGLKTTTVNPETIKLNSNAAVGGGAGLTTGRADAVIRVAKTEPPPPEVVSGARTNAADSAPADAVDTAPTPADAAIIDTELAPLLRSPSPTRSGPIAPGSRPAICESLSVQRVKIRQLARRAFLAHDVYDRYAAAQVVPVPEVWGFDRISDNPWELEKLFPGLSGGQIQSLLEPADSDYRAAIYRDRTDPKKVFLVYRGTSTFGDWEKSNVPQALGLGSTYYSKAITVAQKLKASATAQGLDLELVGHSMGGGMADAAGWKNQIRTTSFNPSGVNPKSLGFDVDVSTASQYDTDYVVDREPLNYRQDHPTFAKTELAVNSTVAAPLAPVALIASLDTLPGAIGRRETLEPDPKDRDSINPINLHRMTGVAAAIDARSRELDSQYTFNECGTL